MAEKDENKAKFELTARFHLVAVPPAGVIPGFVVVADALTGAAKVVSDKDGRRTADFGPLGTL